MDKLMDVLYRLKPCECRNCGKTIRILDSSISEITVSKLGEPLDNKNLHYEIIGVCTKCDIIYKNIGYKGNYFYIKTQEEIDNPETIDNPFLK